VFCTQGRWSSFIQHMNVQDTPRVLATGHVCPALAQLNKKHDRQELELLTV
jgi:hypothetical protein